MKFANYLKLINSCGPNDTLLSRSELGAELDKIPLQAVLLDLVRGVSALDVEQMIKLDNGLPRDFRGLAELIGIKDEELETRFKKSYRPTKNLIDSYIDRSIDHGITVSVNDLLNLLEKLERFDIIDDLLLSLINIVNGGHGSKGISSSASCEGENHNVNRAEIVIDRLTMDDGGMNRCMYDAFVCFAPEDYEYAQKLIMFLEEKGKKIATADDLLPGHFEYDALVQLIETRCRKVLTVLTPNFMRSRECELQTKLASEMALKSNDSISKIIPILFEPCENTKSLFMIQYTSKIDMTNQISSRWQLQRLLRSLDNDLVMNQSSRSNYSSVSSSIPRYYLNQMRDNTYLKEYNHNYEPIIQLASSRNASIDDGNYSTKSQACIQAHGSDKASESEAQGVFRLFGSWFRRKVISNIEGRSDTNRIISETESNLNILSSASCLDSTSSRNLLIYPKEDEILITPNRHN